MKKQILSIALGLVTMAIGTTTYAADKNIDSSTKLTSNKKPAKETGRELGNASSSITSSKEGFIVHSNVDGNEIASAYDKKGNWLYTIERHGAASLLKNVMDIVKDSYYDYFISGMEKVDRPGHNTIYIVHIEDSNSIKTVRVSNGEVEVVKDFKRA